ncbi:MAG: hypothetical protein AAB641_00250, partial [Patescibacteria group bacterium]
MKIGKYPNFWLSGFVIGILVLGSLGIFRKPAYAAPPSIISYQGRLTNSSGSLLGGSSGTTYYFKFSIWDAASGGNKLWPTSDPTSYSTTVREGVFTVNIGDTTNGYPDTLDYNFSAANVFLRVEVSSNGTSFETLSPRQQITSSAFARVAATVESASSTITNLTSANATSTAATSTDLYVSNLASTTQLRANTSFIGYLTNVFASITNLLANGSSTLQNFTAQQATSTLLSIFGTNADAASRFSATTTAGVTLDWIAGVDLSDSGKFKISSSTALGTSDRFTIDGSGVVSMGNLLLNGSSTLQTFTGASSTITTFLASNATSTNLAISNIAAGSLLKTLSGGSGAIGAAVAGTDYLASMTFSFPFTLVGSTQSTTTLMGFFGGLNSTASSTIGAGTTGTGLTIYGGATTTGQFLSLSSTTLQSFTGTNSTTTSATSTDLYVSNLASTTQLR